MKMLHAVAGGSSLSRRHHHARAALGCAGEIRCPSIPHIEEPSTGNAGVFPWRQRRFPLVGGRRIVGYIH